MDDLGIPSDVSNWLRSVFKDCNERITEKLSNNPNIPEQSLDLTWIEHLSRFSAALVLPSEWIVRLDVHYLGGLRHFMSWEIADIGVMLFLKRGSLVERSKVALLQSKRLYPTNMKVSEETELDYQVGLARLADREDLGQSIGFETDFLFNESCKYGALISGSDQVKAIEEYQKKSGLRVYYQFYNPWDVPFTQRVPLAGYERPPGPLALGVRLVPAPLVHEVLQRNPPPTFRPALRDLAAPDSAPDSYGWPLEMFIADEFLSCREGSAFESVDDTQIHNLFYRRTGAIAAGISITIEAPEGY